MEVRMAENIQSDDLLGPGTIFVRFEGWKNCLKAIEWAAQRKPEQASFSHFVQACKSEGVRYISE